MICQSRVGLSPRNFEKTCLFFFCFCFNSIPKIEDERPSVFRLQRQQGACCLPTNKYHVPMALKPFSRKFKLPSKIPQPQKSDSRESHYVSAAQKIFNIFFLFLLFLFRDSYLDRIKFQLQILTVFVRLPFPMGSLQRMSRILMNC